MPHIRFLKRYNVFVAGEEAEMAFPVAEQLVKRGVAEWIDEAECAAVDPPENAMRPKPRKRRTKKRTKRTTR